MTTAEALRLARNQVQLVRWGKQWQVNTWSARHRAWHVGNLEDYATARARASRATVRRALCLLGFDPWDADSAAEKHATGTVRARVLAALREIDA